MTSPRRRFGNAAPFLVAAALVLAMRPAIAALAGSRVERVATGLGFVEGPAWHPADGCLLFTDIPASRILTLRGDARLDVWLERSQRANGLLFDAAGNLYACREGARDVVRIAPSGAVEVLASHYGGRRLNSPNDLALDGRGGVWFTDPRFGDTTGVEQDAMGVYWIAPDRTVIRAVDDIARPNGILVTQDGRDLLVADPDRRALRCYPIVGPGQVGPGRDLFVGDPEADGIGPDGMALDVEGRIYTTYHGINVHAPDGTLLRRIAMPERPTNCAFGGDDLRTLWITAHTSVYRLRVAVPGEPPRAFDAGGAAPDEDVAQPPAGEPVPGSDGLRDR